MSKLSEWIAVSQDEKPFVHFESSLDDDGVVSGYVPVKSTLDVFEFLREATQCHTSNPRAVICHGTYGSGKRRLCTVIARLFRDGFDNPALEPVWKRLDARGEGTTLTELRHAIMPGGRAWHPWLVVPLYEQGGAGTLPGSLIRGLVKALRRARLEDSVLGTTIYHAAAKRLEELVRQGAEYNGKSGSPFSNSQQLRRALEEDMDERALSEFKEFHKSASRGVDFTAYIQVDGGVAMEAHEVYNTVAEHIQQYGYNGIIVIWDEFGFAIEELLRDGQKGVRSLGQETMKLQNFLDTSCGSRDLGKRVVFLGFTHVSISEYGTRGKLGDMDMDRLNTVSGRFKNPSIPIRLSVTEADGYHLLAGMMHRTPAGQTVLGYPAPKLQRLAGRMPRYPLWSRFSANHCLDEIVAPCYPLHPSAASTLLLLSDQIAQVNRTSFYFLQNRQEGGLVGQLGPVK